MKTLVARLPSIKAGEAVAIKFTDELAKQPLVADVRDKSQVIKINVDVWHFIKKITQENGLLHQLLEVSTLNPNAQVAGYAKLPKLTPNAILQPLADVLALIDIHQSWMKVSGNPKLERNAEADKVFAERVNAIELPKSGYEKLRYQFSDTYVDFGAYHACVLNEIFKRGAISIHMGVAPTTIDAGNCPRPRAKDLAHAETQKLLQKIRMSEQYTKAAFTDMQYDKVYPAKLRRVIAIAQGEIDREQIYVLSEFLACYVAYGKDDEFYKKAGFDISYILNSLVDILLSREKYDKATHSIDAHLAILQLLGIDVQHLTHNNNNYISFGFGDGPLYVYNAGTVVGNNNGTVTRLLDLLKQFNTETLVSTYVLSWLYKTLTTREVDSVLPDKVFSCAPFGRSIFYGLLATDTKNKFSGSKFIDIKSDLEDLKIRRLELTADLNPGSPFGLKFDYAKGEFV